MTSYSRQDVLRILQISSRQLQGWERAGIFPQLQTYTFQDLGQLRTLRALREEDVSAASIRHSIMAMKAVAGMTNPLLEASLVRTGARLAFRHHGAMVDPIRRQLLFDFERLARFDQLDRTDGPSPLRAPGSASPGGVQDRFLAAVQAEEAGEKHRAIGLYEEILKIDPLYAAAYINLGTINFHLHQYGRAEELYRRAPRSIPLTCWLSSIWETCWMSCSAPMNPSPRTGRPSCSRLVTPMPTTTWRSPTSAKGSADRPCAIGRHISSWTIADPGPNTPGAKFASC